MSFKRKIPWTSQPKYPVGINGSNPNARGLIQLYSPISGGGSEWNVVSSKFDLTCATAGTKGAASHGLSFKGVASQASWFNTLQLPTVRTILFFAQILDSTGTQVILNPGNPTGVTGWLGISGAKWTVGGTALVGSAVNTKNPQVVVFTKDGANHQIFVDGAKTTGTTAANEGVGGTSFMNFGNSTAYYVKGHVFLYAAWDRVLSDSEIAALTINPWQIFQPLSRNIYVESAAASDSGAGSSSGLATVSGTGASTAASPGTSAGIAAVSGVGASTTAGVGASDGIAAVSGIGAATGSATGASDGIAAVSGTGISTAASTGASSGVATVDGIAPAANDTGVGASAGVAVVSGVGASTVASVGSSVGVANVIGISPSEQATGGGIGHGGMSAKKKKYPNKKVWLVKVDQTDYEVDDLEEIKPIVAAILAKGKTPKVKAKPLVETSRLAAEVYAEQYFLTQYVPMPIYDKRLNFVNILPYIIAMQEMEDEEELLLLAA